LDLANGESEKKKNAAGHRLLFAIAHNQLGLTKTQTQIRHTTTTTALLQIHLLCIHEEEAGLC